MRIAQPIETKAINQSNEKKNWKKDSNIKLSYNEQKEYKNIESKLKTLEFEKKEMQNKFNDPDLTQDEISKLSNQLQVIINEIEVKEDRWFLLSSKMEE